MPMITTNVLNTSEAECRASDTIAPERAARPATSLRADSSRLTRMVIRLTRRAKLLCWFMGIPPFLPVRYKAAGQFILWTVPQIMCFCCRVRGPAPRGLIISTDIIQETAEKCNCLVFYSAVF